MSLVQTHKKPNKNNKSIPGKDSMDTKIINPAFLRRLKLNKSPHMTTRQNNTLVIDPWHINEEERIKQRSGFGDYGGNEHLIDKEVKSQSSRKFGKQYKNNFQHINNSEKNTKNFLNNDESYNLSPSKFGILECPFQFDQDEHEKFHKTQNYVIKQAHIDHNQSPSSDRSNKNFIKKNIRNAFWIQNQIPQPNRSLTTGINKTKTICNQAKQRLLLNNQKLEQSSKQLSRFISMKDPTIKPNCVAYNNNQSHNHAFKTPIQSIWNFSYVEKQLNPEHYSANQFKKMLVGCGRGKSQQRKQRTQSFTKTTESFSTPFQHIKVANSQNHISKKFSRLYQVKKKLALVIEGEGQQNKVDKKYFRGKINNDSHYRIHSLTRNDKRNNQNIELNSNLNDTESQHQLVFQRDQTCRNQQKSMHFQQLPRSFSAKILNKAARKQS